MGGRDGRDVDVFAVSRNPRAHLWRKALFLLRTGPGGRLATGCATSPASGGCPAPIAASLGLDESTSARGCTTSSIIRRTWPALLRQPVRRCGGVCDRRVRRLRQHLVGTAGGSAVARRPPRVLPAFARPAVSRDHAVPRVPEVRRRVQGDGPRAVRRAALRQGDRIAREPSRRRDVRARPLVLPPLVRRGHDDLGRRRADHRPRVHAEAGGAARPGAPDRTSRSSRSTRPSPRRCRRSSRTRAVARARGTSTRRRRTRGSAWRAAAR